MVDFRRLVARIDPGAVAALLMSLSLILVAGSAAVAGIFEDEDESALHTTNTTRWATCPLAGGQGSAVALYQFQEIGGVEIEAVWHTPESAHVADAAALAQADCGVTGQEPLDGLGPVGAGPDFLGILADV